VAEEVHVPAVVADSLSSRLLLRGEEARVNRIPSLDGNGEVVVVALVGDQGSGRRRAEQSRSGRASRGRGEMGEEFSTSPRATDKADHGTWGGGKAVGDGIPQWRPWSGR
jgi:hypothetical protein